MIELKNGNRCGGGIEVDCVEGVVEVVVGELGKGIEL